ncbi:MAG TPA: nuclear transport factor 2 family protein [Gammaproteobacteria bacterium]|nr:nuclear transport factor 2 family protein [Gammaproteobacteria bacterium]
MDDQEKAVISANRNFYAAFNNADMTEMKKIWSSAFDISVIHPGWSPLHGWQDVMASWESILDGNDVTGISAAGERVYCIRNMAYVICTEMLQQNELTATNIFIREEDGWKMVHHQAGVLAQNLDDQFNVH